MHLFEKQRKYNVKTTSIAEAKYIENLGRLFEKRLEYNKNPIVKITKAWENGKIKMVRLRVEMARL